MPSTSARSRDSVADDEAALTASRGERRLVGTATLVFAALLAVFVAPAYLFTGDPEHYVGLARAIATGASYAVNGRPEVRFPPGFPLVLTPAAWLADGSFEAISRWAAALASLALLSTWLYARRRIGPLALPVAILTVCSAPFLSLATGNPMSEPVYLTLSMGLLLWAERDGAGTSRAGWPWALLGCLLVVALPAVRTIGIAAVAAAGAILILEARTRRGVPQSWWIREGLPAAAGLAFVLAWFVWTLTHRMSWYPGGGDGNYLESFFRIDPGDSELGQLTSAGFVRRIASNVVIQAAHIGELLTSIPWLKPAWYSPVTLAIPLLIVGWWRELKTGACFAGLYFLFYLAGVLVWPFDEAERFLLPVVPLLWIYLFKGLQWAGDALRGDNRSIRIVALLMAAVGLVGVLTATRPLSRQDLIAAGFWTLLLSAVLLGWHRLVAVARHWNPVLTRWATIALVFLFVLGSVAQAMPLILTRASTRAGAMGPPGIAAAEWILANTPPDAVIQASFPTRVNFATGRPVVPLPGTTSPEPFLEIQRRYQPEFVVVLDASRGDTQRSDAVRFDRLQQLFPGRWRQVHQFAGGRIYEFR